jgi:hypothetical protein
LQAQGPEFNPQYCKKKKKKKKRDWGVYIHSKFSMVNMYCSYIIFTGK